jgi:Zn-dependent peptidase ImmA (M78 family)
MDNQAVSSRTLPSPEQIAQRLLKRLQPTSPPVNVDAVRKIWETLDLVVEDLDGSGYLLPLGKFGAEIVVNKSDPPERRRFTIAHELGHWVLGLIWQKKSGEFQQPPVGHVLLEKWCDSFAANLLMPRDLVQPWFPDRVHPSLIDAVLRGRRAFAVSDEAFFIRIWELLKIQVVIVANRGPQSGSRQFELDRNYSDAEGERLIRELLQDPQIQLQMKIQSEEVFFSGQDHTYRYTCSGRRISERQLFLAVRWSSKIT